MLPRLPTCPECFDVLALFIMTDYPLFRNSASPQFHLVLGIKSKVQSPKSKVGKRRARSDAPYLGFRCAQAFGRSLSALLRGHRPAVREFLISI
jgi:hypothetical protein